VQQSGGEHTKFALNEMVFSKSGSVISEADVGTATTRTNSITIAQIRDNALELTKFCMKTGPEILFIL